MLVASTSEAIPLHHLGSIKIRRGSHVEPVEGGKWIADMKPVDGPVARSLQHEVSGISGGASLA